MTISHSSDTTTNISTSLKILSHKVVQKSTPTTTDKFKPIFQICPSAQSLDWFLIFVF